METLAAAISAIVEGDLNGLAAVQAATHRQLRDAAAILPPLIISRPALVRVLEDLRCDLFPTEEIQRWASFIRRGYVPGRSQGEIHPIEIKYDANDEALIAEIIGRLDELGDQVDGQIDSHEQEAMLLALRE